jgi:hypothetical protein
MRAKRFRAMSCQREFRILAALAFLAGLSTAARVVRAVVAGLLIAVLGSLQAAKRMSATHVRSCMLGCISFAVSSCANIGNETKGTAFFSLPEPAPAGYATLVIYRERGSIAYSFDIPYYVNGTRVASLGRQTYTYVYIKPGQTFARYGEAGDSETKRSMEFVAVGSESYFLKHGIRGSAIPLPQVVLVRTSMNFGLVNPDLAKAELSKSYRYVPSLVPSL